jgi:NAD(P)-dependent dehydrogenase (short-subunit alcohol dehydrogenase family)
MALTVDLSGKVAIVTGGGRGIGRCIAIALAEAGADVAVAARTESQIKESEELIHSKGRRAIAIQTDVTNKDQVVAMVEKTAATLGGNSYTG